MRASRTQRNVSGVVSACVLGLLGATLAHAQLPQVSLRGLPAEPLIGEVFCVDADFTNGSAITGYGPYLITSTDTLLERISIDFVDVPPKLEPVGTFGPSGQLADPISGTVITGNPGGSANLAFYPVGSVESGKPPLVMEVCGKVEVGAEIGVPLEVVVIPAFEFGDTPTGTNGPVVGAQTASTVTPQLARIEKVNTAPENERPPGPSHVFSYIYRLDISDQVTITDLVIVDNLPAQLQYTGGGVSINAPLGLNCVAAQEPNFPLTPGGTLQVECDAVTGTAGTGDLTASVPVYVTDILDETIPDSETIINTVSVDYQYNGMAYNNSDTSNLVAVHAAAQKSASGTGTPGSNINYAIRFQVTDYPDDGSGGASAFVITDILPDGLTFVGTIELDVNGTVIPVAPTVAPGPSSGSTQVTWDIADALGGVLPTGSDGTLTYTAAVDEFYSDGVTPVKAADVLNNDVGLNYALTNGGGGSNGSSAAVEVPVNTPKKLIVSPNPMPSQLMPGQEVTFRLQLEIPAGATSNVVFTDYLPRPVFDVADFNQATDIVVPPGPFIQLGPMSVSVNTGDNSIRLEYGDVQASPGELLAVDLKARITTDPFADDLFLTNLFESSYERTNGDTISGLNGAGLNVGAPDLILTKGVVDADNPRAVITPPPPADPAAELVDGDVTGVDAADVIDFVITVENLGGQSAYSVTVKDPVVDGLTCDQSTLDVRNGLGNALGFTGNLAASSGLVLDDPLPGNDSSPPGGGAPFGADTALISITCAVESDVDAGRTYRNEANVTWVSAPGSTVTFPPKADEALVEIARPEVVKSVIDILPGYNSRNRSPQIGEIVTYQVDVRVPEGQSRDVRFEDLLDEGLAFVSLDSITATANITTSVLGGFTGVLSNATFNAQGSGDIAADRLLIIGPTAADSGFGTVTNSDTDNGRDDIVTLVYRTRVLNTTNNQNGNKRRNRADWAWLRSGSKRLSVRGRAPNVTLREPDLRVNKTVAPNVGDETTPPVVTLVMKHSGATTGDAFQVVLEDQLPIPMLVDGVIDDSGCTAFPPDTLTVSPNDRTVRATWSVFPENANCTLKFQTRFSNQLLAGLTLNNCAEVDWESLNDADLPLDSPPNNTLAVKRTGDVTGPGGAANDYRYEGCDDFKVLDVGIVKTVSTTSEPQTDNLPAPPETEPLTIGEQVLFELVATIPETATLLLNITDRLPIADMVLEFLSVNVSSVGSDLIPNIPNPTPIVTDRDGDGINDTVELDFGRVDHMLDGVTDERDRIRILVEARVNDLPINRNNELSANSSVAEYLPGRNVTDEYGVELVEPTLEVLKIADRDQTQAGESVSYRLILEHRQSSRMSAQNVQLIDVIPPELVVVASSLTPGNNCGVPPDTLSVTGQTISAFWTTLPLGATCEIDFDVLVDINAVSGTTITNRADIAWTSLRNPAQPQNRNYTDFSQWPLLIGEPGLDKEFTGSNITVNSGKRFKLKKVLPDITIGETATFTIVADFADGTTEQVEVIDQLPFGNAAFKITRSQISGVGADLSLSSGVSVGDAGVACASPRQDCIRWVLGDIVNQPDSGPTTGFGNVDNQVSFEIDAIVLDDPANSGAPGDDDSLTNLASLTSSQSTLLSSELFGLIEPQLDIRKLTEAGGGLDTTTAGERHKFTLSLFHTPDSTADALQIEIEDQLNPNALWVDDSSVTSTCPGVNVFAPVPGQTGMVRFTLASLPLTLAKCEISYVVEMQPALPVPGEYPNRALLDWESAPGSPESRTGNAADSALLVAFNDGRIDKRVTSTSVPETGSLFGDPLLKDVTIGEIIEYEITTFFAEGTTRNVVLTDIIQQNSQGALEFVSGELVRVGSRIIASPSPPVVSSDAVFVDYGDVVNQADGVADEGDAIVYRIRARVTDVAANSAGRSLTNQAELRFSNILGIDEVRLSEVDVDIVEPLIELTKRFVSVSNAEVRMEFDLKNTGSAPAYEILFTDEFDEQYWEPLSLTPITVPPGYSLSASSAAGMTTVSLVRDNAGLPPDSSQILLPGDTGFIAFSMRLKDNGQLAIDRLDNTALVTANTLPNAPSTGRVVDASDTDTLVFPRLDLEKQWSGSNSPAVPGDNLTYRLELENSGAAPATAVRISDTPDLVGEFEVGSVSASTASGSQPGGIVIEGNNPGDSSVVVDFTSVGPGQTVFVEYRVRVPLPFPAGQSQREELENQGQVDAAEFSGILSDDPSTPAIDDPTVAPIVADPVMVVDKTDSQIVTEPGERLIYTITYGNAGDQDATGVVITEQVPLYTRFNAGLSTSGWSCPDGAVAGTICRLNIGSLAGSSAGTVEFAVQVDPSVPSGADRISNEVMVEEDGLEYTGPSTPSTDTGFDETLLFARPDIAIDKDDGGISVVPGQAYFYGITTRNPGVRDADSVVLLETVPANTVFNAGSSLPSVWDCPDGSPPGTICRLQIGTLSPGFGDLQLFGLRVFDPVGNNVNRVVNKVEVTGDGGTFGSLFDDATDDTPVIGLPDLQVLKTVSSGQGRLGQEVTFDIEYRNVGDRTAFASMLTETVPEGSRYSATASAPFVWSCADGSPAGTVCQLAVGDLFSGTGGMASFGVQIVGYPPGDVLFNRVIVSDDGSSGVDPTPENNVATASLSVAPQDIPVMPRTLLWILAALMMVLAGASLQRRDRSGRRAI